MLYGARNGRVQMDGTYMGYSVFGRGVRNLVMVPGLGEGLRPAKGMGRAMALMFRQYAAQYRVYIFNRKAELNTGCTTRDMAKALSVAMKSLGIDNASVLGVSQGGMIAQYLAIDYPRLVEKLALAVTLSRQNNIVKDTISRWLEMAEKGDYKSLFIDTAEKTYTEDYLKKYRTMYPVLTKIGKPKDFTRFIIQAHACLSHDSYKELYKITCPTLVIGGAEDLIVGGHSSPELYDRLQNAELKMYENLRHGVYDEARDFHKRVMDFFR